MPLKPPQSAADAARRALEVRREKPPSQRGMTPVGIRRAAQIANRQNLSLDTVQRMAGYFSRHLVDKRGETWSEQGKGWQAWHGWGGDAGARWALSILRRETPEWFDRFAQGERNRALIRHLRR